MGELQHQQRMPSRRSDGSASFCGISILLQRQRIDFNLGPGRLALGTAPLDRVQNRYLPVVEVPAQPIQHGLDYVVQILAAIEQVGAARLPLPPPRLRPLPERLDADVGPQ